MKIIYDFIEAIEKIYGKTMNVGYEYDEASNVHRVWHNSKELEANDDFSNTIGELIFDYIYAKDIYNFAFVYDYAKVIDDFEVTAQMPLMNINMAFNIIKNQINSDSIGEAA